MRKIILLISFLFPCAVIAQTPHVFASGMGFSVPANRVLPIDLTATEAAQVAIEGNKLTFSVGGIYMLTARISWQFNGTWAGSVWIQKNDAHEQTVDSLLTEATQNLSITPPPVGGWITPQKYSAAGQFRVVAGDYIKLCALHSSVFPQNFTGINLEITRIAD